MWQVIGQEWAVSLLKHSLESDVLSHAYLFIGPQHVGKMTLAINLAQALNCGTDNKPCLECDSCRKIAAGSHSDVQVLGLAQDEEENTEAKLIHTEQVKDMLHSASLPPFEGSNKVFIIDGAELLSTEAANRLLKTLEEPEAYVTFILLTTDENRLLKTVVSRCQRIELPPMSITEETQALTEKFGVSRPTIRQALSALEVLGAIECVGGKGNYIRDRINLESLRYRSRKLEEQISPEEILECRKIVESGIVVLAAKKAEQSDIVSLEKYVDEYRKLAQSKCDKNVFDKIMQNSRDFHFALAKATQNAALIQIMRFVIRAAKAPVWLNLRDKMLARQDRLEKHLAEHEDILNSVKNGNGEKAKEIMKAHIKSIGKDVFD